MQGAVHTLLFPFVDAVGGMFMQGFLQMQKRLTRRSG
jgi:hypothetical protein